MTRLATKVIAMGLLLVGTYALIWVLPAKPYLVYSSILDKHARLDQTPAPRLIFVGGSGIALGLDSALIEAQVHLPVVNMGVNAGFGLRYMLEEVKAEIRTGDTIVVVPEYEHFYGELLDGDQNLLWALRVRPASIQYLSPAQVWHLLPEVPRFMQLRVLEQLRWLPDPIYNRSAFNQYGDFVSHLRLPVQTPALYDLAQSQAINPAAIQVLTQFAAEVQAKGATMVLIYPAVASTFWRYHNNAAMISQLHRQLTQQTKLMVLGQPTHYLLPATMFFDTVYHLSGAGRAARSSQIADQLTLFFHDQVTANRDVPTAKPSSLAVTRR